MALLAAQFIENLLSAPGPQILALGTGRTLLETVREVTSMERPDHKVVSAVGNLTRDGRASPYDVAIRLADRVGAQCYPLPVPVLTDTREECEFLKAQRGYGIVDALVRDADAEVLGVGSIGPTAPLLIDGFVTPGDLASLADARACAAPAHRAGRGRPVQDRRARGGPRRALRHGPRHRRAHGAPPAGAA